MTLTLRNASAIIDHHHTARPATQRYTRTWHHASQLTPGDLWRPDPDQAPHTVTEVHRTRGTWDEPDQVTLVDQYAHAYSYRSNDPGAHRRPPTHSPSFSSARSAPDDHHHPHPRRRHHPRGTTRGDGTNHLLNTAIEGRVAPGPHQASPVEITRPSGVAPNASHQHLDSTYSQLGVGRGRRGRDCPNNGVTDLADTPS